MSEVSLRVLYTVNTSPQYILAKAPHKIPFIPSDSSSSDSRVKHGRASLKACAVAICRSSPELRPDATRDFSLYILDPLEDLISNRNGQTGGVAVGLGLLSATLSPYTPDTTMVTGTFVDCGQDENALEVVMSLRQVAPPVLHPVDSYSQATVGPKRTKANSKRAKSNQPYLTSNPLPLPSFNDRLFAYYAQPRAPEAQKVQREPRKPDPAHSTRAHQLPTPYIGPPKRKYLRDSERDKETESHSSRESTDDPPDLPSSQISEETNDDGTPEPASSDLLSTSDTESVASSSTIQPSPECRPPDVSEAAVMLAALSSVSSKSTSKETTSTEQEHIPPNPELVSFLRAYLGYLEAQQQPAPVDVPPSSPSSLKPTSTAITSFPSASKASDPSDKENQKPQPPVESSKVAEAKASDHVPPLGSSRHNATSPDYRLQEGPVLEHTGDSSALGDCSRKRKLSNADLPVQDQTRRRASSVKLPHEDLSGVRQNRGWGGLRVRSDGTLWGEQRPVTSSQASSSASSVKQSENPVFFRSSGQAASAASIRKGPYVVPDWAKGVPPPAPPPKQEGTNGDDARARKQGKSKSLNRLGGRATIKRSVSMNLEVRSTSGQPASLASSSHNMSSAHESLSTSIRKSPGRPPIFAYSSPVGKSKMGSLFQAFQTSPCRPASVRKSPSSTPFRPSNTSPGGSAYRLSLFTPSPSTAKKGSRSGSRLDDPFADDDAPPSPTPTKRSLMGRKILVADSGPTVCDEESITLPSSLPIASSDDALDGSHSSQTPTTSSDSTIMNFNKVHDWSSLDLPPSSPPPPSSPSITPIEGSDLPCSDIPSSDLSEADSPAVVSYTSDSNDTSPAKGHVQSLLSGNVDANLFEANVFDIGGREDGPNLTDTFPPLFDIAGEENPTVIAAFEALQNGLGQEDLSEGWRFLDSLFGRFPAVPTSDAAGEGQTQNWISETCESVIGADFGTTGSFTDPSSTFETDVQDPASIVATNFQDLLDGCLV